MTKVQRTSVESLIQRKQELEDRKVFLEFQKIQINKQLGQIDDAQAALEEEMVKAAMADGLIERRLFKEHFCQWYKEYQLLAEAIDGIAEGVMSVITQLYPAWMTNLATASSVAVLAAVVLTNRGISFYCKMIAN